MQIHSITSPNSRSRGQISAQTWAYLTLSLVVAGPPLVVVGLCIALALFAVRIPVVHVSLIPGASFTRFEAVMSNAMNTKGLAAAVAASIPYHAKLPNGEEIMLVAFAAVLFTILIASVLEFLAERGWFNHLSALFYWRYKVGEVEGRSTEKLDAEKLDAQTTLKNIDKMNWL